MSAGMVKISVIILISTQVIHIIIIYCIGFMYRIYTHIQIKIQIHTYKHIHCYIGYDNIEGISP